MFAGMWPMLYDMNLIFNVSQHPKLNLQKINLLINMYKLRFFLLSSLVERWLVLRKLVSQLVIVSEFAFANISFQLRFVFVLIKVVAILHLWRASHQQ
jgi:hypothetical protein